ncbi:diacylglycerol kinase family protein [Aquincola sp. MAHUQ-54]|uniref:Diacylglycerol kinase family protein n=1 Tax=Aquincola agrisoli TaxID=3119538 RepID=A0AAW9QHA8_9BURK
MTLPTADAPFFVVLNPGSGRDDAHETKALIERVLTEAGRAHEVLMCAGTPVPQVAMKAVERACAEGGIVVAAGGDGTINAVVQAVLGRGCALGVLPQGTFNYFGRVHGIPLDTEAATRALLDATVEPVQVGQVNDRVFIVNASVGLYPQLLEDREAYKQRYGRHRLVALWSAVVTLFRAHRPLRMVMRCGGEERNVRTLTLFVGNNPLQLRQIGLPEAPLIGGGRLAAVMLRPVGTLPLLRLLLQGALGRLGEADDVLSFPFEELSARPALPRRRAMVKVAVDGEIIQLRAPLRFAAAPEPLPLLVPRHPQPVA